MLDGMMMTQIEFPYVEVRRDLTSSFARWTDTVVRKRSGERIYDGLNMPALDACKRDRRIERWRWTLLQYVWSAMQRLLLPSRYVLSCLSREGGAF